ncbi:MAG TPA: D-sedoheptulose 7-phosphate isomerase [Candidatus Nanoarchaeia archaeon]|nr:D-sedoheptulose 7-phosphate isomerase [Candidatus Nanoarchaeia archaeon]
MEEAIKRMMDEHIAVSNDTKNLSAGIAKAANLIVECLRNNGKVLVMGNGGSATQASHFAAELVGRYKKERKGYPCIALNTDIAILTAVGNDYGFENVFSRQVEALAKKGDVLIGLSTSGNSANVIRAIEKAKEIGCKTITLTGNDGGKIRNVNVNINIGSKNTPRIQEMHIMILHIIAEIAEEVLK